MFARFEWTEITLLMAISFGAFAFTAWQMHVDRSVFERVLGPLNPLGVIVGAVVVGFVSMAYLKGASDFAVLGPGESEDAISWTALGVPLFAVAAMGADIALRYPEDTNVAMPHALRFYPAVAVLVEIALHAVPIALLVAILGSPTGLNTTFWRLAIPVALVEAGLQAAYATSPSTAMFSVIHVTAFGVAQVWMFWKYGFVWMLGFRLGYYCLWHVAWGVIRLNLLF